MQEALYGVSQTASFTLSRPASSIVPPAALDGSTAAMSGTLAGSATNHWTWTALQPTSFVSVNDAYMQVRFFQKGWRDDRFVLEYTTDDWATVRTLATYDGSNRPANAMTTYSSPSLFSILNTPAAINAVQMRFRGVTVLGGKADAITLNVDQVRLVVTGNLPTATATATRTPMPTHTPTATHTPTVTGTPSATGSPTATQTPTVTNTPTAAHTPTFTSTPAPPAFHSWAGKPDSATTLGNPTPVPGCQQCSGYAESGQPWQTDGSLWESTMARRI